MGRRMEAYFVADAGDAPGKESGVLKSSMSFFVSSLISWTFSKPGIIAFFGVGSSSEA